MTNQPISSAGTGPKVEAIVNLDRVTPATRLHLLQLKRSALAAVWSQAASHGLSEQYVRVALAGVEATLRAEFPAVWRRQEVTWADQDASMLHQPGTRDDCPLCEITSAGVPQ